MITTKKPPKKDDEQPNLIETLSHVKHKEIYILLDKIFDKMTISQTAFKLILLINTLQELSFILDRSQTYIWSGAIFKYFADLLSYTQSGGFSTKGENASLSYFLVYALFIAYLGTFGWVIYVLRIIKEDPANFNQNPIAKYLVKFLSLLVIRSRILVYPAIQILASSFFCVRDATESQTQTSCYRGSHLLKLIVALFTILMIIMFYLVNDYFLIDTNPSSVLPFAGFENLRFGFELSSRILVPILSALDYQKQFRGYLVGFCCLLYLSDLCVKLNSPPYFHHSVNQISLNLTSLKLCACLCLLIKIASKLKGGGNSEFLTVLVMNIFFCFWTYNVWKWVLSNTLTMKIKRPPTPRAVQLLVFELLDLINHMDSIDNYIKFHGFLNVNRSRVRDDQIAHTWDQLMSDDQAIKLVSRKEEQKLNYFKILVYLVKLGINRHPKSNTLWLLLSHLEHSYMDSKWNSVYSMQCLLGRKPNPRQILSITRTSQNIEKQLGTWTLRDIEVEGLDLPKIITVQNQVAMFVKIMHEAVTDQLKFWKELKEEKPSIRKLLSIGATIRSISEDIDSKFKSIILLDKLSLETLTTYRHYLKFVTNNERKAKKIFEMMIECKRQIKLKKNQFNATMDECIILVSGNKSNFAEIQKVGKQVNSFFGYKPKELIGNNVRILLPEHIGKIHDKLMKGYFIKDKKTVMDKVRVVFGRRKDGALVALKLRLKVLPSIMDGIRLIGLLSTTDISFGVGTSGLKNIEGLGKPCFIVFDNFSSDIIGASASCEKVIGLKPDFYEAQDTFSLDMDKICPEIFSKQNQRLFGKEQITLTIDMSGMLENHELRQDLDESYRAVKALGINPVESHTSQQLVNNRESGSQQSFMHVHPNFADCSFGDIESSYDEESEELKKRFRKFKADAWVCRFEDNTDYDLCCLLFYLQEQSVAYLSQRTGNDQNALTSLISSKTQAQLEKANNYRTQEVEKQNNSKFSDSEKQGLYRTRMIKEIRKKLRSNKQPQRITYAKVILVLMIVVLFCLQGLDFLVKRSDTAFLSSLLIYETFFELRNMLVLDIRFYNRKMELIANKIIQTEQLLETRNSLKNLVTEMNKAQVQCLEAGAFLKGQSKEDILEYEISIESGDNGRKIEETSSYSDALFQYISSTIVVLNSKLSSLERQPQEDDTLNHSRFHFSRINENSLNSIIAGGMHIAIHFKELVVMQIPKFVRDAARMSLVRALFTLFCYVVFVFIMYSANIPGVRAMSLLALLSDEELSQLISNCEWFLQNYLKESVIGGQIGSQSSREKHLNLDLSEHGSTLTDDLFPNKQLKEKKAKMNNEILEEDGSIAKPGITWETPRYHGPKKRLMKKQKRSLADKNYKLFSRSRSEFYSKMELKSRESHFGPKKGYSLYKQGVVESSKVIKSQAKRMNPFGEPEKRGKSHFNNKYDQISKLETNSIYSNKTRPSGKEIKKNKYRTQKVLGSRRTIKGGSLKDAELSAEDRQFDKIEYMEAKASRPFCIHIIILTLLLALSGFMLSLFKGIDEYFYSSAIMVSNYIGNLGTASVKSKATFNIFYEILSVEDEAKYENYVKKLDESISGTYDSLNRLNLNKTFPVLFREYGEDFKLLYFNSICSAKFRNTKFVDCGLELFERGIETTVIYAIEQAKSFQRSYLRVKQEDAKRILNSNQVKELEFAVMNLGKVFKYLLEDMIESCEKAHEIFKLLILFSILAKLGLILKNFFIIWLGLLNSMNASILVRRSIVTRVPSSFVLENESLRKLYFREFTANGVLRAF